MTAIKPTARDIHRAVEFVKSCPPGTDRPAALAHEFAAAREDFLRQFEALIPALSRHPDAEAAREYNERMLRALAAKLREE